MNSLKGKYISILGASTSTFDGFSNNTDYNSTLVVNLPRYPMPECVTDVKDTWWMRTIKALDLNLCVNNSWRGSCVTTVVDGPQKAGCMNRATQLHNDNLGIEPDIIILIIGGNDAIREFDVGTYDGVSDIYDFDNKAYIGDCTRFGHAYATMVHKVKNRYPYADIYVCSMLGWKTSKGVRKYNDVIEKIAKEFRVNYVDFYNHTKISPKTTEIYLHTDGVHPNKLGFEQMSQCVINAIKSNYSK